MADDHLHPFVANGTGLCGECGRSPSWPHRIGVPEPDAIELVAERLHAAYLADTAREGEAWPPQSKGAHLAWRRAAAEAIDLGATP